MIAEGVIDVILGEAGGRTQAERYEDMLAVASVIANRSILSGLPPKDIVSVKSEFNAYGKALPPGAENLRSLAEKAWNEVQSKGPVHNATFFATSGKKGNLPSGLKAETKTTGHEYFSDPKGRSFRTAEGFVTPATRLSTTPGPAQIVPDLQAINNPYAGLVPPSQVQLASLPQTMAPPSFRPEMPRGLETPVNNLPSVSYSLGPKRPDMPDPAVVELAQRAVKDVLGPQARIEVFSGKGEYGSNRHRTGFAIDARVYDKNGTLIGPATHPELAKELGKSFARQGATGRGFGTSYMGGKSFHIDIVEAKMPGYLNPATQGRQWGDMAKAMGADLDKAYAMGPLPDAMPAPPSRPSDTMMAQASPATGARAASGMQGVPSMAPTAMAALGAPASGSGRVAMDVPAAPGPFSMAAQAAPATTAFAPVEAPPMTAWNPSPARPDNLDYRGPTFSQAAPALPPARSIEDRPIAAIPESVPITVPPSMLTPPTVTPPAITPPGTFPAAPPAPGRQTMRDAALGGARGIMGGPVGMIAGAIAGPAIGQIGRNIAHNRRNPNNRINPLFGVSARYRGLGLPSFGGLLTGIPAPNYNAPQYSVGSGYGAIGSVFGAPAGATARSRSNPEIGFMSLGNGYVSRTNDRYGTTQTMAPGTYDPGIFGGKAEAGKGGKGKGK